MVLIIARGWREQATPWASRPDFQTPNLAKFAEGAAVFPRAYSASPSPGPARAATATGRFPHVNGVVRDGAALNAQEVTMEAVLGLAGYHTSEGLPSLAKKPAAPFYVKIQLDPPENPKPVDASKLQLPENIPSEFANAREDLAKYYGALKGIDEQLGRVMAAIPDNTVAIFLSDCGAQIGSHGIAGNDVPFEETERIPLAIRFPGVVMPGASDLLVSQVDLLPTLLALCGQPAFEGIQGRNLAPLLLGGAGERPEWVFAEGKIGDRDEWRMLVQGMDKIVVDANGEVLELYNLADDPHEMNNRAQDSSVQLKRDQLLAVMRTVRSQLLDFRRR